MLNRRQFLSLAGASAFAGAGTPPNILFVIVDDLGWADVGFHGSEIETPNLDRLARSGVEFGQHYATPTCSPTRTAIMSGRFPGRYGVTAPTNERVFDQGALTLPAALRTAGYDTCISGKWHLGSRLEWGPRHYGFNRSYGCLAGGINQYLHRYKHGQFTQTWHRDGEFIEEEGHSTDLIARQAVRYIETPRSSPFFIYTAFTAPHIPLQEPVEWRARYQGKIADPSRLSFAAAVTHMDDAVGRLIAALDRTGQRDRTLVVFTSDNGAQQNWGNPSEYPGEGLERNSTLGRNTPWRGWKGEVYEGGIRVPAFVNWPGTLTPGKYDAPLHVVDWMPTLCHLSGYQSSGPTYWDGRSFWPLSNGGMRASDRVLYWRTPNQRAVRQGAWKLIVKKSKSGSAFELYNLEKDPYETKDLAASETGVFARMKETLTAQSRLDRLPAP